MNWRTDRMKQTAKSYNYTFHMSNGAVYQNGPTAWFDVPQSMRDMTTITLNDGGRRTVLAVSHIVTIEEIPV